jgi:hypothetical protein
MGGLGGASMFGGQGRFGMGNGMGGGMYGAQGQASTPSVRTALSIDFEHPAADPKKVSTTLGEHLMDLPGIHWRSPVQLEMQGRTAILRGAVATAHDRDLAERVVRLEATIEQVQNQLAVVGPGPRPAPPPERSGPVDSSLPSASTPHLEPAAANSPTAQPLPVRD